MKVFDFNINLVFFWKSSCEAKVANFYSALVINKNIGWLEVSMDEIHRVTIAHSHQNVIDYYYSVSLLEVRFTYSSYKFFKIAIFLYLHDQEDVGQAIKIKINLLLLGVILGFCIDLALGWQYYIYELGCINILVNF